LFIVTQKKKKEVDEDFTPLNIACVFSPPAQLLAKEGDQKNTEDIKQLQEDLLQEREDNKINPEEKKLALIEIIDDYNKQFKTNHNINEFDGYYQDVQSRIKNQKYSNRDYAHKNKIDITIVVDMLLTGFDSKFLNTLYVDKNLKHHGLIQAFSRTNRVLNDTKPYGNILDFRSQQEQVNQAIALFSGESKDKAIKIWMVEPAHVVIEDYKKAVATLGAFMEKNNLAYEPDEVYSLRGDSAKIAFVKNFKEVQSLKTQLDQYTDLDENQKEVIESILPTDRMQSFRSSYLETAKQYKAIQDREGNNATEDIQQLDFEFVLFASAVIDYDYIMNLVADNLQMKTSKQKMSKDEIIRLLSSTANLMEEQEDLTEFIGGLDWSRGISVEKLNTDFQAFKDDKNDKIIAKIAHSNGLQTADLKAFVVDIMSRLIFDGEKLTDLLEPLELNWKERSVKEQALMTELINKVLIKQAQGREISGLSAYE
jgi:type I restriction enzyme R subunit